MYAAAHSAAATAMRVLARAMLRCAGVVVHWLLTENLQHQHTHPKTSSAGEGKVTKQRSRATRTAVSASLVALLPAACVGKVVEKPTSGPGGGGCQTTAQSICIQQVASS